jgi:hypothetical protein
MMEMGSTRLFSQSFAANGQGKTRGGRATRGCGLQVVAVALLMAHYSSAINAYAEVSVDRAAYEDRLRGFWLGASIGNWTGLPAENLRSQPPFFTRHDWRAPRGRNGQILDYVLESEPWGADDDTDIEYVYLSALVKARDYRLSAPEIARAWREHIGLPRLWVSNLAALGQLQRGVLPPATSLPENNPMWEMIDAQLTTEIFGALAPTRPDIALQMAHLPIRTTAYLDSAWAAEFYVIMHALVPLVDPRQSRGEQVRWMAAEARKRIPDNSYIADMYDFARGSYENGGAADDWERLRDRIYERYQVGGAAGYRYQYPWDSGINFAASMVSLFYGDGDFRKTLRIGTLAGWDADNPTATWGGLLGLLYGYDGLREYFNGRSFSDQYRISDTRYGFPDQPDTFAAMAKRGVAVIDRVVIEGMGGRLERGRWVIPVGLDSLPAAAYDELAAGRARQWRTVEDSDPRWVYRGFQTEGQRWNASGATLTSGRGECRAEISFEGTAVRYFAFRNVNSGRVRVSIDDSEPLTVDLSSRDSDDRRQLGQYYVKVYERQDLQPGPHRLVISCEGDAALKTIDMLSVR